MARTNHPIYEVIREDGQYRHIARSRADVPSRTPVYEFVSTPGHGYLKVPLAKLRAYDITRQISEYSYVGRSHASLEEDRDYGVFLKAILNRGERFFYSNRHAERANAGMARYHPSFAEQEIVAGSQVTLTDGRRATVQSIDRRYTEMLVGGALLSAPTRTLFNYLAPDPVLGYAIVHAIHGVLIGWKYSHEAGVPNHPIWATGDEPKGPRACLARSVDDCVDTLKQAGVAAHEADQCQYWPVNADPWTDGNFVDIGAVAEAGLPTWPVADEHKAERQNVIRLAYRRGEITWIHDSQLYDEEVGKAVEHTVRLPGRYVEVPGEVMASLPNRITSRMLTDGDTFLLPSEARREYIKALDSAGRVYVETGVWQDDPLWYRGLQPAYREAG